MTDPQCQNHRPFVSTVHACLSLDKYSESMLSLILWTMFCCGFSCLSAPYSKALMLIYHRQNSSRCHMKWWQLKSTRESQNNNPNRYFHCSWKKAMVLFHALIETMQRPHNSDVSKDKFDSDSRHGKKIFDEIMLKLSKADFLTSK